MVNILVVNIIIFGLRHYDKDHQNDGDSANLKEEDDSLVASVVPLTDTHAVFHLHLDCHAFKRSFSKYQKANLKLVRWH